MINIWIANLADCFFGDPYFLPHPVRLIGSYISGFEKMVRKVCKGALSLKIAGIMLMISTLSVTYLVTWLLSRQAYGYKRILGVIIEIVIMYFCLAGRCLHIEAYKIMDTLVKKDIEKARNLLSFIVGRDTYNLDETQICRAVIETVSENTSDGIIAPLFYMFIGGAPLAMAYKAVNTLDSMVGYKNDRYMDFGWASAKIDDIVNYIPARLSALFLIIASFVLNMEFKNSIRIVLRDRRKHTSPNSGYPEAAAAGALGIMLGGENYYFGKLVVKPTIGDNIRKIEPNSIKDMVLLMYGSWFTALIIFTIISYLLRGISV